MTKTKNKKMNNKLLDPSIVTRRPFLTTTIVFPCVIGGLWLSVQGLGKYLPVSSTRRMSEAILVISGLAVGGFIGISIANYIDIKSKEK